MHRHTDRKAGVRWDVHTPRQWPQLHSHPVSWHAHYVRCVGAGWELAGGVYGSVLSNIWKLQLLHIFGRLLHAVNICTGTRGRLWPPFEPHPGEGFAIPRSETLRSLTCVRSTTAFPQDFICTLHISLGLPRLPNNSNSRKQACSQEGALRREKGGIMNVWPQW